MATLFTDTMSTRSLDYSMVVVPRHTKRCCVVLSTTSVWHARSVSTLVLGKGWHPRLFLIFLLFHFHLLCSRAVTYHNAAFSSFSFFTFSFSLTKTLRLVHPYVTYSSACDALRTFVSLGWKNSCSNIPGAVSSSIAPSKGSELLTHSKTRNSMKIFAT